MGPNDIGTRLDHFGGGFDFLALNLGCRHGSGSLEGDIDSSRPPIGEALASDTLEGFVGAILIINAQRNAIGIAEVELAEVAMQCFSLQC
jgi:hypothetical protein